MEFWHCLLCFAAGAGAVFLGRFCPAEKRPQNRPPVDGDEDMTQFLNFINYDGSENNQRSLDD